MTLLKDLPQGMRFKFSDKSTPIEFAGRRGSYEATGVFVYNGVGVDTCPKLIHQETGTEILAVSGTYWRSVLIIFK